MSGVLSAESAILAHLQTIGVILLVLHGVVVSLLALRASQSDLNAHNGTSLKNCLPVSLRLRKEFRKRTTTIFRSGAEKDRKKIALFTGSFILSQGGVDVNNYFTCFLGNLLYDSRKTRRGY